MSWLVHFQRAGKSSRFYELQSWRCRRHTQCEQMEYRAEQWVKTLQPTLQLGLWELLTTWSIVSHLPHGHLPLTANPHVHEYYWQWLMQKQFISDQWQQSLYKCRNGISQSHQKWNVLQIAEYSMFVLTIWIRISTALIGMWLTNGVVWQQEGYSVPMMQ